MARVPMSTSVRREIPCHALDSLGIRVLQTWGGCDAPDMLGRERTGDDLRVYSAPGAKRTNGEAPVDAATSDGMR